MAQEDASGLTQGARRIADTVTGWLDRIPSVSFKRDQWKGIPKDNPNRIAWEKATASEGPPAEAKKPVKRTPKRPIQRPAPRPAGKRR